MKRLRPCTLGLFFALSLSACAGSSRSVSSPVEQDELALTRVVLYRSGVGYFERTGTVENGVLRLRVRKDHINDLLKSLTIVDRGGKALSVSMPLDPQHWAAASLAQFEGTGRLAQTLDALRGTEVTIRSDHGRISGRIMMVELIENTPMPAARTSRSDLQIQPEQTQDYLISLLHGNRIETARLSRVEHIVLQDGDLAMQLHRSLDAGSGEGMFHQVDLEIRLSSREKAKSWFLTLHKRQLGSRLIAWSCRKTAATKDCCKAGRLSTILPVKTGATLDFR